MSGGKLIRLGLLGCGHAAKDLHSHRLAQLPELFSVLAVCDRDEAAAFGIGQRFPGASIYLSADKLLADQRLDAVAILTPSHAPFIEQALLRGLDLYVEKPFCETPEQAQRLTALARQRSAVVAVGNMRIYDLALDAAHAALSNLGDLRWVELRDACGTGTRRVDGNALRDESFQAGLPSGFDERRSNALQTALLEMVHNFSILRGLFGLPLRSAYSRVAADGWSLAGQLLLDEYLPCQYGVAEYGLIWRAGWDISVSVIGTDGIMRLSFGDANDPQQPTILEVTGEPPREFATDTYLEAWKTFHHCVHSRSRPRYDAKLGAADVSLAWEIMRQGTQ